MRPHHNDLGEVWKLDKIESEIIPPNIRSRDLQNYDFWLVVFIDLNNKSQLFFEEFIKLYHILINILTSSKRT